jgi:hypothetical protein
MKNKVLVVGGLIGAAAIEAFWRRAGMLSAFRGANRNYRAGEISGSSRWS